MVLTAAVEGPADEAVLKRVIEHLGAGLGDVYGKRGKSHLLLRLRSYNQAACFSPWLVLVDLNSDADCAPTFRAALLPSVDTQNRPYMDT